MATHQDGRPRPAGIRDVARMAGVSVASASFALNGQPGVAEDTRRRILAGNVISVTFLGATSRITVDLGDTRVLAQLPTSDAAALSAGSRVTLAIRPDPVLVSGTEPAASTE